MFTLTDNFREWQTKLLTGATSVPAEMVVGLYADSFDAIGRADDLAQITSEPGGSYARQTLALGDPATTDLTADRNAGSWRALAPDVAFDVVDATQTVDGYFVAWVAELAGDDSPTQHLMGTAPLRHTYDLAEWPRETFTLKRVSLLADG